MIRTSQAGIDLIKEFEGLKLKAYFCPAGIPTIGWGHTATVTAEDVRKGRTITKAEADDLLERDLRLDFEPGVRAACKIAPNQNQFDAFVSMAYNIGVPAFQRSTALRRHNEGNFQAAANAIELWNKATVDGKKVVLNGLVRRRAAEKSLYLKPMTDEPMPQDVAPERSLGESRTVQGGAVAGVATIGALLQDAASQVQALAFLGSDIARYGFLGLVCVGVGAMLYARLDDWTRGRR